MVVKMKKTKTKTRNSTQEKNELEETSEKAF